MSMYKCNCLQGVKNQAFNSRLHLTEKKLKQTSTNPINNRLNVQNNITIETNNYLNYIEINEGTLDLIIKFPSGSRVSMVKGKTNHVLQQSYNYQCKQ